MPFFDLPLSELESYQPDLAEPPDFDQFWAKTLTEGRALEGAPTFVPTDNGLVTIDTFDVTFAGFGGHLVRGWLHLPATRADVQLPAVVEYIGYGNGRGLPHERTLWAAAGYAHFVMDTRGQGAATPDPDPAAGDIAGDGFLTRGIADPHRHYYRRVFTDAVRAVDAARQHPAVDPDRIAVTGTSQGGGIALAAAGLVTDLIAVMPDVPFLCDFPRATTLTDAHPYNEVANFLQWHRQHADELATTLSYLDCVAHAKRANAPALFSVALMDPVSPPSCGCQLLGHRR